jgi:hypothetical protein
MYTIHYTLYTVHYTLYTLDTIYTIHYILYTLYTLYTIPCTLYTVHYIHDTNKKATTYLRPASALSYARGWSGITKTKYATVFRWYIYAYIHIHTHICIYTYTHTHTHTHTHIYWVLCSYRCVNRTSWCIYWILVDVHLCRCCSELQRQLWLYSCGLQHEVTKLKT